MIHETKAIDVVIGRKPVSFRYVTDEYKLVCATCSTYLRNSRYSPLWPCEKYTSSRPPVIYALQLRPVPVEFQYKMWPTIEAVNGVVDCVKVEAISDLHTQGVQNKCLPLLRMRLDPPEKIGGRPKKQVLRFRDYFKISNPTHRRALSLRAL